MTEIKITETLDTILEEGGIPSTSKALGTWIGPDLRAVRPDDGASKSEVSKYLRTRSIGLDTLSALLQSTLGLLTSDDAETVSAAMSGAVSGADRVFGQEYLTFSIVDGLPTVAFESGEVPPVKTTKKVKTLSIADGLPVEITTEVDLTPDEISDRQDKAIERARKLASEAQRGLDITALEDLARVSIALAAINRARMEAIRAENPRQSPKSDPDYIQANASVKALGKLSEACGDVSKAS